MLWIYDIHFEALKEPVLSYINFKTSIKKVTCENTFFVTVHIFFTKPCLSYMSKKRTEGYKIVQGITSINFFPSSNFANLHGKFKSKI